MKLFKVSQEEAARLIDVPGRGENKEEVIVAPDPPSTSEQIKA